MTKSVALEEIVRCGVERGQAIALWPRINHWLASGSADECWQGLTREVLKPTHPFALHQGLYDLTFTEEIRASGLAPAWFPTPTQIETTNIAALMQERAIASYADLHTWSIHHRADFWAALIQRLGIRFRHPYTQLVNLSQGVESPQWLVNAQFNIVESCFQASPEAIAIVSQSEQGTLTLRSYGDLRTLANRVSNGLVQWGFQPGEAIAIDLPMHPESVAIYLGVVQMGGVVVSIADSFAAAEIATRLRLAKAKAIFTQDVLWRGGKPLPLYAKVIAAEAPRAIVLAQDGAMPKIDLRSGDVTWNDFLSDNSTFEAVPMAADAPITILFSSGTTGDPKAIPWTQTTPIKCATDGHLHHDLHPGDVVAWSTNLGWMMGPWLIYASLINQATIALYDGAPTTRGYGEFIQSARVTMLGVVPSLVRAWRQTDCVQGLDWSAIRAFSSTGECSHPEDMLFLMALAGYKPIIEYCGGTEIGGAYVTGTVVQPCIPATFTTPALGLDFVILDEDDHPASKGEVFLVPPSIGLSTTLLNQDHHQVYFADTPDLDRPLRRHGDYLEQLANGYYRAQGRVDDTMNIGGIKVSAAEIEQAVNTVDGICETAAIAHTPADGGPSRLVLYTVVKLDCQSSLSEMKTQMQAAIAHHLNPLFKIHDVRVVAALPRTASNKVMRRTLRQQYQESMPALSPLHQDAMNPSMDKCR